LRGTQGQRAAGAKKNNAGWRQHKDAGNTTGQGKKKTLGKRTQEANLGGQTIKTGGSWHVMREKRGGGRKATSTAIDKKQIEKGTGGFGRVGNRGHGGNIKIGTRGLKMTAQGKKTDKKTTTGKQDKKEGAVISIRQRPTFLGSQQKKKKQNGKPKLAKKQGNVIGAEQIHKQGRKKKEIKRAHKKWG